MRISKLFMTAVALLLLMPCAARAQQISLEDATKSSIIPVKIQIVLTEYDGAKKIDSLPYTIPINVQDKSESRGYLRNGVRIPIISSQKAGEVTYVDVGTNIDVHVRHSDDGRFAVELTTDRSWLDTPAGTKDISSESAPMIHQSRSNVSMLVRDGQAAEQTIATDPLTGQVLKVDVSLTVLK
jgi:hypothetical protein